MATREEKLSVRIQNPGGGSSALNPKRGLMALTAALLASMALAAVATSATPVNRTVVRRSAHGAVVRTTSGAVVKTFSFISRPNSRTTTVVNIDSLLINARCDSTGNPVIFAFTSANNADLFGRLFDGQGRLHTIRNSAFTRRSQGVSLAPNTPSDFNSSGTVMFENSGGQVVTVNYAFDNATTLARINVCTVYGSIIAS